MKPAQLLLTLLLALVGVACAACASGAERGGDEVVTMTTHETDLTKLRRFINLPEAPRQVLWQTMTLGTQGGSAIGPSDWVLLAAIEYDEATLAQIEAELQAAPVGGEFQVAPDFIRDWFPEPIKAAFAPTAGSSSLILTAPRYSADRFARPPLQAGYVVIRPPWIFIYLQTT